MNTQQELFPATGAIRSFSYRLLPVIGILVLLNFAVAADAAGTCPPGYSCTSCGADTCIICPSDYVCLNDIDAVAQFGNPEQLNSLVCGYRYGIDRSAKYCYRQPATTVSNPPVAKIIPDFVQDTAPLVVHFTAAESHSATEQISSYSWNFGDGQTGSGVAVTHTYQDAGTYSPALTVSDVLGQTGTAYGTIIVGSPVQRPQVIIDSGNAKQTGTITAQQNQQPIAVFSANPNHGTGPLTVSFDGQQSFDPDGTIASYSWDFGDHTTGTGYVASHSYNKPGTYVASLSVTDNAGTGSPATLATITVTDVTPQQPVTPAQDRKPRVTSLLSDPDYTNADFMKPDAKIDVIPREYKGSVAVAGGTLQIRGSNFGNRKGTVEVVLDSPIEAYSLDKPYAKKDPLSLLQDGKKVLVGITGWSDNTITLNVEDISSLFRANFRGGEGTIYVTTADGVSAYPYTFYLSPKWNRVQFSGYRFFNPSHNTREGYTSQVRNHVLTVKHNPGCGVIGENGRDDFFRESWVLPPNVRFSQVNFQELKGDANWFAFAFKMYETVEAIVSMNYFEMAKIGLTLVIGLIDGKAGTYTAYVVNAPTSMDPPVLTYQKELMVNWENTCFDYSPYNSMDISYMASYTAYVPEGVDLGE